MGKFLIAACLLFSAFGAYSQGGEPFEVELYDEPAEHNGLTGPAVMDEHQMLTNISQAKLTVYLPRGEQTGQLVILCPGGAYISESVVREGSVPAGLLNQAGIAAAVLQYRLPNGNPQIPLKDLARAIELVRENAGEWGIDPARVGVMGFSAGGHLAATAATQLADKPELRPDFAVLVYPVINMDAHTGSRRNLLGADPSPELLEFYSNDRGVTPLTPPTFIAFSDDDEVVPSLQGTAMYDALRRNGVPAELHIYPTGGHGWAFEQTFPYRQEFVTSLFRWLSSLN